MPTGPVLLGMNAHINFDLAQSLLAVISEREFDDPELLASRRADHQHIDVANVLRRHLLHGRIDHVSARRAIRRLAACG